MNIYKIINKINNKIYIGQDSNDIISYYGGGVLIKKAIQKYGKENFIKEILETCSTKEELCEKEQYWISYYNSTNLKIGYNITGGGNSGNYRHIMPESAKLAISENNAKYWLGKHIPEETKEKIRKKRKNQNMEYRYSSYQLIDRNNNVVNIYGVTRFLKEYNISKTQFYRLIKGEISSLKGFKLHK